MNTRNVVFALLLLAWCPTSIADTKTDDLVQAGDLINDRHVQKPFKETKRAWDLAISGCGYFPLQDTKTGEMLFTRLGRFEMARDGFIVLAEHPTLRLLVMSSGQKIEPLNILERLYLRGAPMVGLAAVSDVEPVVIQGIHSNGEIVELGRLVLAKFFNNGALSASEANIFSANDEALPYLIGPPTEKGLGAIRRGFLEQL